MRRIGLIAGEITLALVAVPAGAQAAAYPIRPVLDAFRAACPTRAATAAALDGGMIADWDKVAPERTPVGELLAFGRAAGQKALGSEGRILGENVVYTRRVAGEDLYLIVSGVETSDSTVRGCRLYDPAERRVIDAAAVADWVGHKPDETLTRKELTKLIWNTGLAAGQNSFELFAVPAGSPVIAITKIDGLAVKADWVDTVPGTSSPQQGSEE